MPQMVGGGTVHWQGWLPRFTPEDFRLRSIAGEVPGTTLVDWPISYDDLEPYYTKVEWAFGVSGPAGANAYEGRRSQGYPCPPMPQSRYAEKFHKGCANLGLELLPDPAGRAVPTRSTAARRPWSAPSPSNTATPAAPGPARSTCSSPTLWPPAATTCGRSPTSGSWSLDGRGKVRAAIYLDADGNTVEQEADVFVLAGGAIESARLLLMSQSARFPNGLANGSDLVGRNVTFHEYSASVGTFDDPINAWAGGGYVSASSFEFYNHDASRDFVSGGHIAAAGVGIPLPINWHLPGRPTWGAEAKKVDRELFNHSMAVAMVLHDMPQHDNRVDLDPDVTDAWGFPGRPDHPEDARERPDPGSVPGRPLRRHPGSGGCSNRGQGLSDPGHRQLLPPARHHPDGHRSRLLGAGRELPSARGRQPVRGRRRSVADRHRSQPDPDDDGQRLAGGRPPHRRRAGHRRPVLRWPGGRDL